MNKKLLFFLFYCSFLFGQTQIQGIVIDNKTKKPLPFASVVTNTNFGSLTDIEGKFFVKTKEQFNTISISYIGYETVTVPVNIKDKFISIQLKTSVENLNEVLITAKENPAIQIIRDAIANKKRNNIEKYLSSFKFNSYNKILVTANPDSVSGKVDSIFIIKKNGVKEFSKLDSSNFKFKKEIDKQHLFISEKVSEFNFQKGKKKKEIVLASRMAGLNQPIYELLAVTFQDFSFYNEFYTIAGTKYTNPIANNALKHYNYKILDTVKTNNKSSFLIYFKPKIKNDFLGIEGVLYLDNKSFAITKAIAELKGILNVKATQNYTYKSEYNIWFPQNMDIILRKGNNDENINLFGGIVKISKSKPNDTIVNTKKSAPDDVTYFISKTNNSNIEINTPLVVKKSSSTIQFNDDAHKKNEEFWNKFRTDSLTKRGYKTYTFLDSIAKEENVEKMINLGRNVLKGYYPTKFFNLNIGKVINLNNYEGLRVGFGGITNSNFSSKFRIEAYVAYGTKDKDFKFRYGSEFRFSKQTNTWIGANFTNDLKEVAALDFIAENTSFSPINPRNLNIDKFYNYKTINAYLKHDIQPNLESKIQFSTGDYASVFDYTFNSPSKTFSNYKLTTATLGLQYNPGNEYMNSPVGKLKIKNKFPQFTFQLMKSFNDVSKGNFDFTQINLRILHKLKPLRKAQTTILVEGGMVFGEAPISHLFNSTPNYTYKNPWVKRITFAGKNSFETMGYNEFISDKFGSIHIKHEFTSFKISSKFRPQISVVSRATIGSIDNPEYHLGLNFKGLQKGYFESGLEFNSLFKGFGLSAFYRYGTYQNPKFSDNLAVKLTFKLRLGF